MSIPVSDSLLEKINALLRMAEHPNSNTHEASNAMERAQALLLKHNLDRASLNIGAQDSAPERAGMLDLSYEQAWRPTLAHVIAKASLCRVVRSRSTDTIHIFGTRTNVKAVVSMYLWIAEQLESMALHDFKAYKAGGGDAHGRTWKASYFTGAISQLSDRLSKPMADFAQGEGRELVLYQKDMVDKAVRGQFPNLVRGSAQYANSGDGLAAGRRAGGRVSFSQPGYISGGRLALPAG